MTAQPVPAADGASSERVRGYRPELDAVRCVAFSLVFLFHVLPFPTAVAGQNGWRIHLALLKAASSGLCLFFTLSAYLITELLLAERASNAAISVRKFYIRRALRIWPLYFFGIAIGILIAIVTHRKSDVTGMVWYLFFAGNIYCGLFGWLRNPMSPLWSISIEEQFYLLWPWAVRGLSRRKLALCALSFIAGANIALLIMARRHATDTAVWTNTFVQFEMFAAGILLALGKKLGSARNAGIGCALALAGPVLWFAAWLLLDSRQPAGGNTAIGSAALMISFVTIALGCAAILQGFCMIGPSHMPRLAIYLGKISFGLYVYHVFAIELAHSFINPQKGLLYLVASTLLALLLTIAAAVVSYDFLERPFLRFKRRFEIVHSRPT